MLTSCLACAHALLPAAVAVRTRAHAYLSAEVSAVSDIVVRVTVPVCWSVLGTAFKQPPISTPAPGAVALPSLMALLTASGSIVTLSSVAPTGASRIVAGVALLATTSTYSMETSRRGAPVPRSSGKIRSTPLSSTAHLLTPSITKGPLFFIAFGAKRAEMSATKLGAYDNHAPDGRAEFCEDISSK